MAGLPGVGSIFRPPSRRGLQGVQLIATVTNGPQFQAQMLKLGHKLSGPIIEAAVEAGLVKFEQAWKGLVPTLDYHYSNAVAHKTYPARSVEPPGQAQITRGATGSVFVGRAPGASAKDQPWLYAALLEFGGQAGKGRKATIPPQPSARPAFDNTADTVVSTVASELRRRL